MRRFTMQSRKAVADAGCLRGRGDKVKRVGQSVFMAGEEKALSLGRATQGPFHVLSTKGASKRGLSLRFFFLSLGHQGS